ncbi:nuclear transport factor 2 family protein [Salinicoccus sp. Marseille-QA3877]
MDNLNFIYKGDYNILKKDAAILLSTGKFHEGYSSLSDDVRWNIIDEKTLSGIDEVETYFKSVGEYFQSVTTDFKVNEVIETEDKVVVIGTGEFYRDDALINVIEACDVYIFENNKVTDLKSYCIPLKNIGLK